MQQPSSGWTRKPRRAIGEQDQDDGRGQGETGPGREASEEAGTFKADAEPHLAAGWPGQKLAQGDKIGKRGLVKPPPAYHQFVAKIADMGDRAAEAAHAQFQKNQQHLGWRTHRSGQ